MTIANTSRRLVITLAAVGTLSLVALVAHAAAPAASDAVWAEVSESNIAALSMMRKSIQVVSESNRPPVVTATFRWYNKDSDSVDVVQYYVLVSDCRKGQGRLAAANMAGQSIHAATDWATGAGSSASMIADTLCAFALRN
jgi:hypothetical protein